MTRKRPERCALTLRIVRKFEDLDSGLQFLPCTASGKPNVTADVLLQDPQSFFHFHLKPCTTFAELSPFDSSSSTAHSDSVMNIFAHDQRTCDPVLLSRSKCVYTQTRML